MQIRHTRPEDLPAMQEIFADARAFMRENGNLISGVTGFRRRR